MAAYTTIDDPELYFQIKLYTGNGGTQSITLDGSENMQPDWVWFKNRSSVNKHRLFDSVRGVGKNLVSNNNGAEIDAGTGTDGQLRTFDSNGFSVGSDGSVNTNNENIVAWNWKAGTSFSNDASSTSVGSIDSAGTVSTEAGFSIIQFSGTGSLGTVAHGLGAIPNVIFFKRLDANGAWASYHETLGATKYMRLDSSSGQITASDEFNDTEPTSTVFTVQTDGGVNASGTDNMIAYCFTNISGYSKFGGYTGNNSSDGTFVHTGFKPAWLMVKKYSDTNHWIIWDNKRSTKNGANIIDKKLYANLNYAENGAEDVSFVSNGFKFHTNTGDWNEAQSYIYLAFAESPFVNSNGIPNNAE